MIGLVFDTKSFLVFFFIWSIVNSKADDRTLHLHIFVFFNNSYWQLFQNRPSCRSLIALMGNASISARLTFCRDQGGDLIVFAEWMRPGTLSQGCVRALSHSACHRGRKTTTQLAWLLLHLQGLGFLQESAAARHHGAPLGVRVRPGLQPAHPQPGKLTVKQNVCFMEIKQCTRFPYFSWAQRFAYP